MCGPLIFLNTLLCCYSISFLTFLVIVKKMIPTLSRAWIELLALRDHSSACSMDAAQSLAANKLADFLQPEDVAFVPLMQQLLAAEDCVRVPM